MSHSCKMDIDKFNIQLLKIWDAWRFLTVFVGSDLGENEATTRATSDTTK